MNNNKRGNSYNNYNNKFNNNNGNNNKKFKRNRVYYETPVPYVSKLDETKLELVKVYDENNEYSVKLPIFNGKGGIETFLHVLTKFLKAAQDDLEFYTTHDYRYPVLISRFAKVLENEAYSFYQTQRESILHDNKDGWMQCITQMKISFGGGTLARDHIAEYLKTTECTKKKSSTVEDHVRRIKRIINIANEVQGTIPQIDHKQALTYIKDTMPRAWQANFSVSGISIESCSEQELINYFAQQKRTTDFTDFYSNNRSRSFPSSSRYKKRFDQSRSQNDNNKRTKSNNDDPEATCPIHPNGKHTWGQCFHNARRNNQGNTRNQNNQRSYGNNNSRPPKFVQHSNSAWRAPNNSNFSNTKDNHFIQDSSSYSQVSQLSPNNQSHPNTYEHHAYDLIGPTDPNTNGNNHADNNHHCGWSSSDANGTWLG